MVHAEFPRTGCEPAHNANASSLPDTAPGT